MKPEEQVRRSAQSQPQVDRDYLQRVLATFRNSVKEARFGVVRADMETIVDVLNRLDLLIDEAAARLGVCVLSPNHPIKDPLPSAESKERLSAQLRLEAALLAPPDAGKVEFRVGQVWKKPNGKRDFVVWRVEDDMVELRWCVHGRLEKACRLRARDVLKYAAENEVRPVPQKAD